MPIIMDNHNPKGIKTWLWFGGLWLGGLASVSLVALVVKLLIRLSLP